MVMWCADPYQQTGTLWHGWQLMVSVTSAAPLCVVCWLLCVTVCAECIQYGFLPVVMVMQCTNPHQSTGTLWHGWQLMQNVFSWYEDGQEVPRKWQKSSCPGRISAVMCWPSSATVGCQPWPPVPLSCLQVTRPTGPSSPTAGQDKWSIVWVLSGISPSSWRTLVLPGDRLLCFCCARLETWTAQDQNVVQVVSGSRMYAWLDCGGGSYKSY